MGKATNPAAVRKQRETATKEQHRHGSIARVNGIDVNHGASPLTRWKSAGQLSDSQLAAIGFCQRIWALIGLEQRTTASYGERTDLGAGEGESGAMILRRMRARDDLARLTGGYVNGEFRYGYVPKASWDVFENCIRFDIPAGVVGLQLGQSAPSVRALSCVQFVADLIAMNEGFAPPM